MGKKIFSQIVTMFSAAFGVVAALAWDDLVKTMFSVYYPKTGEGIFPRFVYAVMVTCIFVLITTLLAHLSSKSKRDD